MYVVISHEEINNSLAALKTPTFPDVPTAVGATLLSAAHFVVKIYHHLLPLLMVLSSTRRSRKERTCNAVGATSHASR